MTPNAEYSYRQATHNSPAYGINRKCCARCEQYKMTADGTTIRISPLSSKRVFVCKGCK